MKNLYIKDTATGKSVGMSAYYKVEEKIRKWEAKGYTCELNGCFLYVTKKG